MLKQKEIAQQQTVTVNPPTKVITSTQAQSKPPPLANATLTISNVENIVENKLPNWDPVPPLAPLSGPTTTTSTFKSNQMSFSQKIDDDSNSNSITSSYVSTSQNDDENSRTSSNDLNSQSDEDTSRDILLNKQSQVVTANKMLADLLDKKSGEPPHCYNDNPLKRKLECDEKLDFDFPDEKRCGIDETVETVERPSTKAADVYAKLAASLLEDEEDEDMEVEEIKPNPPPKIEIQSNQLISPATAQSSSQQVITVPIQRQIIMSPNNQGQMMFSPQQNHHQIGGQVTQTTATIKTESGYQTVPVILQHTPNANALPKQIQIGPGGQILQPIMQQPQQTQYVLATNQQGQTCLVAQNPAPQLQQTLLVTQTPQQQGTSAKTIIILQPQGGGTNQIQQVVQQNAPQTQKVIMTTQQGQQVVVTQVPRPMQHVIVNHAPSQQQQIIAAQNHLIAQQNQGNTVVSSQHNQSQQVSFIQSTPNQSVIQQVQQVLQNQQHQQVQHIVQQNQQQHVPTTQIKLVTKVEPQTPQQSQNISQQQTQIQQQTIQKTIQHQQPQKQQFIHQQQQQSVAPQQPQTTLQQTNISSQQTKYPEKKLLEKREENISRNPSPALNTASVSHSNEAKPSIHSSVIKKEIAIQKVEEDLTWPWVCDWRGCPK